RKADRTSRRTAVSQVPRARSAAAPFYVQTRSRATCPPSSRRICASGYSMSYRALIIRPSSLGDIVHAMPIVHDLARHRPGISVDWVAEEAFASLVSLNRGVRRVIPLALRRWRHAALSRSTWREFGAFRRALQLERYDIVIDLQ